MYVKVFLIGCFCALSVTQGDMRLRIIHTNNLHSRFDQVSRTLGVCTKKHEAKQLCYGGFARILTAANAERKRAAADGVPIIFLDAGDASQGSIWYAVGKWPLAAQFMKILNFDAIGLGVHEFDGGPKSLTFYLKSLTIPAVVCNIDVSNEETMKDAPIHKSIVLTRGGLKIGIIGFVTIETATLSYPGKVKFKDEIESIKAEVKHLKNRNVNIIIGLSSAGYERDKEIAARVAGLDVIVGGHNRFSSSFLYTGKHPDIEKPVGPYPTIVKNILGKTVAVVHAYSNTKYLGFLEVVFDDRGYVRSAHGNPILIDYRIKQDLLILKTVNLMKKEYQPNMAEVLATSRVMLNGNCSSNECNLGNLITDALVDFGTYKLRNHNWTGVAIALYPAIGICHTIKAGMIRRRDIIWTMPYFSRVQILSVKGNALFLALEWSVSKYNGTRNAEGTWQFLQFSGLHVVYDLTKPPWQRVVKAFARCARCTEPLYYPIHLQQEYAFVTNSFIYSGDINFIMFKKLTNVVYLSEEFDTNVVINYLRMQPLLYIGREERIVINFSSALRINPIILIFCTIFSSALTFPFEGLQR